MDEEMNWDKQDPGHETGNPAHGADNGANDTPNYDDASGGNGMGGTYSGAQGLEADEKRNPRGTDSGKDDKTDRNPSV